MTQHWVFGALLALCHVACADPPVAEPSAQPAAVESEARADEVPLASASASATGGSEVAVLSADKPAAPPSASMSKMSDAHAVAMAKELNQLDLGKLSALNSARVPVDRVLRDGAISDQLMNDAARRPGLGVGAGGLDMGSGGELRSAGGNGISEIGSGSRTIGSTIGGKTAKELTAADLDAALGRAGCSTVRLDSPYSPSTVSVALFEAKCASLTFAVTFVPAGVTRPDAKTIAEMDRLGATWSESGMLLAIVPKDKDSRAAAVELMTKLRSESGAKTGPKGQASIGGAAVSSGSVPNASSVVAGMAAAFRRCYNRGLQEDPKMKGSVRVTAKIGPNGEVLSALPAGGGGLSGTVTSCIAGVVSSRQFSPPEGGGATIVIPVSFTPVE